MLVSLVGQLWISLKQNWPKELCVNNVVIDFAGLVHIGLRRVVACSI